MLPELPNPQAHDMPPGPTPWSNWVIPGRVLAGAYPASLDDVETEQLLTLLLELGVNTFVCLQAEVNIHIPEHSWRSGVGLRPYIRDAQRLLSRAQDTASTRITQRKIDFLHLPIIDGSVTTDSAMSRLADDCCERVLRGETMYIHCWGGHGRTGTLVAVMLGRLYDLPAGTALRLTQAYHDTRVYPQGVRSPQTTVQRAQVKRLLLMPNPFAGAAKVPSTSGGTTTTSSSRQQALQQSPAGSQGPRPGAFAPGSPMKQPPSPSTPTRQSRTIPVAAARVAGSPSSTPAGAAVAAAAAAAAVAATAAGRSMAAGSSPSAARTLGSASYPLSRPPVIMGTTSSTLNSSSSSSYQPRLLHHQMTAPPAMGTAAARSVVSRSGSFGASSGGGSSKGVNVGGISRQQWLSGAAPAAAVPGSPSQAALVHSRVHSASSPLLRSDMLRTPQVQQVSRLVQPGTHSPMRRTVAVVDGTT